MQGVVVTEATVQNQVGQRDKPSDQLAGRAILDPVRRRCVQPAPDQRTLQALIARYELVLLAGWLARLSERTCTPEEFLGDVDMARAGS